MLVIASLLQAGRLSWELTLITHAWSIPRPEPLKTTLGIKNEIKGSEASDDSACPVEVGAVVFPPDRDSYSLRDEQTEQLRAEAV